MTPFGAKLDVLRRIAIDLEGDSDPDRVHFGIQLDRILNGGESFHEALGLPTGWFKIDRRAQRDLIIADMAKRDFAGLTGRPLADATHEACIRYEARSWCRDRDANRRPDGLNGRIFDLLMLGKLPSNGTFRNILNPLAG